ncbi:hypothetical protein ACFSTG_15045 [Salinimicrobium flavum]|uniref:Lipoprotein n=2 Tax=Salinimicrobium flavum TaxID=1737065 RepID=A0ABW5IZR7_9FLAO
MRISIYILFLAFFITGCKEKQEPETTPQAETTIETSEVTSEAPDMAIWKKDIQLDNGTQWHANRETTEGILKMSRMIENSSAATVEDYRRLGEELNKEKNLVIKRCTMKGPSHDNLHIYLQPLIGQIGELQQVDSADEGEELLDEIREHLQAYHSYFI